MTTSTVTARYLRAAVLAHTAPTLELRDDAAYEARYVARQAGIDELAAEAEVLAEVFRTMTAAELTAALRDPSRRTRARAELARRA